MASISRYYIVPEGGTATRIPRRVVEGLIRGSDTLPEYANTSQRVLWARIESEGSEAVRIIGAEGSVWHFDESGAIRDSMLRSVDEAMRTAREPKTNSGPVVQFAPRHEREKWRRENRWEPQKEDYEAVLADFERGQRIKMVTGTAPRRPPLTYEAKDTLHDIEGKLSMLQYRISTLSEPALKGLAFAAQERGREDPQLRPIWEGVAGACDRECEVRKQRRRKGGVWFAVVEVFRSDATRNTAEVVLHKSERCHGRDAAKKAAQKLVRECASYVNDSHALEASIVCELDYEADGS